MIFLVYFLILCLVFWLCRKIEDTNIRKLIVWLYNYIAAFVIFLKLESLRELEGNIFTVLSWIYNAIFYAFKGVVFERGFRDYSDVFSRVGNGQSIEIQIWSILIIASLSTAHVVTALFFKEKLHQLNLWFRYSIAKNKTIIVSDNENATALITDISRQPEYRKRVITLFTSQDLKNRGNYLNNVRIKRLDALKDESPLKRWNPSCHCDLVLMLKDENENVEWLIKLRDSLQLNARGDEKQRLGKGIRVTVLCNNQQLRYHDWSNMHLDAYLVSEEQLIVDKLMKDHSPVKVMQKTNGFVEKEGVQTVREGYHICIIGFGDLGEELLLSYYENSRFMTEDLKEAPFHACIIDKNLKVLKNHFLADLPYFKNSDVLEFIDTSIGTEEYYQAIDHHLSKVQQFFIATGDSYVNLQTALKLKNHMRSAQLQTQPEIIVFIRNKNYDQQPLTEQADQLYTLSVFKDIYTYENLILRKAEEPAQKIHNAYRKKNADIKKVPEWEDLDVFMKDTNRAVARDILNKKALLARTPADEAAFRNLARYEHYRWCAFLYARGWSRLYPEQLSDEDKKAMNTKRKELKKHLCLVSWDELRKLPCQKDENTFQEYDYISVVETLKNEEVS